MNSPDQVSNNLLLVKPAFFGWNEETSGSNIFQNKEELSDEIINENAQNEFSDLCMNLTDAGIKYLVFESSDKNVPDSVFPNNWISTHHNGSVIMYPMQSVKRRKERNPAVPELLRSKFHVHQILDLSYYENENRFLEGTGSIVFDHKNQIAYAALSIRTHEIVLKEVCKILGYEYFIFESSDRNGNAIYHTNVLLNIGETYAIICSDAVADSSQRKGLLENLKNPGREIIEIDFKQLGSFAGNMLQVRNQQKEMITLLSSKAFDSLTDKQVSTLLDHTHLLRVPLTQTEKTGGGSVRCMVAEVFLQEISF